MKVDPALIALYFYIFMMIATFGEAMNHYGHNDKRVQRVADSTMSAMLWPFYVSYRMFDDGK